MKEAVKERIAVINYDACNPVKCGGYLCEKVCPVNRTGKECIVHVDSEKPTIDEALCIGCGICVKKCPFQAIHVINLSISLPDPVHQYGQNLFRLYRLPNPKKGTVVGLVGRNGIGKTTTLNILAGKITPNLGKFEEEASLDKVVEFYHGKEIQNLFQKIRDSGIKISLKPQNVDDIPQVFKGTAGELLKKVDERNLFDAMVKEMGLGHLLEHKIKDLSGGELQRLAITAAVLKEADIYCFDEPSSYLDVKERLKIAKTLRRLAEEGKSVLVIEHDLAVLDYLSDYVHILFGKEAVYGVTSHVKSVRQGINEFLEGYIKDENIRFRGEEIKFEVNPPTEDIKMEEVLAYPALEKKFDKFSLKTEAGNLRKGEVIGILGPNAIGKTTFVKMLAGILKPDKGKVDWQAKVSYKPQYIQPEKGTVKELFARKNVDREFYRAELKRKLKIAMLEEAQLKNLSGGELQRVAVAYALSQKADIYLLDEPSAFLDVEQRLQAAEAIKNLAEKKGKVCLVVDHDILFQDYVSNRVIVFEGQSGKEGQAKQALSMREGMNLFLKNLDITFRRDPQSGRPRANKPGSVKEQEQKQSGEYYYHQF